MHQSINTSGLHFKKITALDVYKNLTESNINDIQFSQTDQIFAFKLYNAFKYFPDFKDTSVTANECIEYVYSYLANLCSKCKCLVFLGNENNISDIKYQHKKNKRKQRLEEIESSQFCLIYDTYGIGLGPWLRFNKILDGSITDKKLFDTLKHAIAILYRIGFSCIDLSEYLTDREMAEEWNINQIKEAISYRNEQIEKLRIITKTVPNKNIEAQINEMEQENESDDIRLSNIEFEKRFFLENKKLYHSIIAKKPNIARFKKEIESFRGTEFYDWFNKIFLAFSYGCDSHKFIFPENISNDNPHNDNMEFYSDYSFPVDSFGFFFNQDYFVESYTEYFESTCNEVGMTPFSKFEIYDKGELVFSNVKEFENTISLLSDIANFNLIQKIKNYEAKFNQTT